MDVEGLQLPLGFPMDPAQARREIFAGLPAVTSCLHAAVWGIPLHFRSTGSRIFEIGDFSEHPVSGLSIPTSMVGTSVLPEQPDSGCGYSMDCPRWQRP